LIRGIIYQEKGAYPYDRLGSPNNLPPCISRISLVTK